MTLLYTSPRFLDHQTGHHPESSTRLRYILKRLEELGLAERATRPTWEPATIEELATVHAPEYLAELEAFTARGGGRLDEDTVVSRESYDVARLGAGAVCDAVRRVTGGEDATAFSVVRPPGHHALAHRSMGYCLLGNVAIGAKYALNRCGLDRVLIVDWDVHHGNGTQDMFYDDGRVGFFSAHRWPFYPGTGDFDETGRGDGLGATRNLPVTFGTSRREYLAQFAGELAEFAAKLKPQLVIVSAGFDAHRVDPVGSLGLETEDFEELTRIVREMAADHAEGRVVSVLEGGYNPAALAECAALHLEGLLKFKGPVSD